MKKIILLCLLAFTACKKDNNLKKDITYNIQLVGTDPGSHWILNGTINYAPNPVLTIKSGDNLTYNDGSNQYKNFTMLVNNSQYYAYAGYNTITVTYIAK